MLLWYNGIIAFASESDRASGGESYTVKLGGSQVPELKNKNINFIFFGTRRRFI